MLAGCSAQFPVSLFCYCRPQLRAMFPVNADAEVALTVNTAGVPAVTVCTLGATAKPKRLISRFKVRSCVTAPPVARTVMAAAPGVALVATCTARLTGVSPLRSVIVAGENEHVTPAGALGHDSATGASNAVCVELPRCNASVADAPASTTCVGAAKPLLMPPHAEKKSSTWTVMGADCSAKPVSPMMASELVPANCGVTATVADCPAPISVGVIAQAAGKVCW